MIEAQFLYHPLICIFGYIHQMGICMVKREPYSKADKQGVEIGEGGGRKVRYLDYSQSENKPIFDESLERTAVLKVLGGANGEYHLIRSSSKASQKKTQASYLTKQRSFKDMERTSSTYNKELMVAIRSDAMTPSEIILNLKQRKGEK